MDWESVRKSFMIPEGVVYLNNGTAGPCPRCVFDKMVEWQRVLEANPAELGPVNNEAVKPAKEKLAAFVGIEPANMVFVMNVTVGMNMVAAGPRNLKPGDEILITDQEYNAVSRAWEFNADKRGCVLKRVAIPFPPESSDQIVSAFEQAITPRTRVLVFAHITSSAIMMPVQRLCKLAKERGILTAVDGAHAPGMIPLDVPGLGCDFYVGNCHKWLCAPKGSGFFYAAPHAQGLLAPFVVGHGWAKGKETFLGNFESPGTHSPAPYIGAGEAVDFQNRIGRENIAARGRELTLYGREALAQIPGVRPATPAHPDFVCSMASYFLPPIEDELRFARMLGKYRITVPGSAGKQGGRLRVSSHIYNTTGEIDLLVRALREAYGK